MLLSGVWGGLMENGIDFSTSIRFFAALVVVLALVGLTALLVRRSGLLVPGLPARNAGRRRRLQVVESLALDMRHRLLLIRRDGVEHLLVLGVSGCKVVETGIRTFTETLETTETPIALPVPPPIPAGAPAPASPVSALQENSSS